VCKPTGLGTLNVPTRGESMSTTKQKQTARKNLEKARSAQARRRSSGTSTRSRSRGGAMTTAQKNDLPDSAFAFPEQRKEPLTDAKHVRNAVARFDQVEGVSNAERDRAWRRIRAAARKHGVEIEARGWRELFEGGKARKKS
jgi:hypothetical protein